LSVVLNDCAWGAFGVTHPPPYALPFLKWSAAKKKEEKKEPAMGR
jgi:hypothetical protein